MSSGYYLLDYNPGTKQYTFPRRGGHKPSGTVIMHTAECLADNIGEDLAAEGSAHMIANRADHGAYHCLCDSDSRINMAPWEYEVWGDSETNNWAVHISAALRTIDWITMPADRADRVYWNLASCAADFVVYMRDTYGIVVPLVRISGAQARARVPGFCAHGDSGIARSDPGKDFDWGRFFNYTQQLLDGHSPQEDELSEAQVQALRADLFHVFDRLVGELPGAIAKAVLDLPIAYAHPETAEVIPGQPTTLRTMVVYNDFQHSASRRQIEDAAARAVKAIVDSVKATSNDANVGLAVDEAYAEFLKKISAIKLDVSVVPPVVDSDEPVKMAPISDTAPSTQTA